MTDLAFGKYSLVVFGKESPYILVRNFLCVGLPYFALGAMLKRVKAPYFNGSQIMLWVGGNSILTHFTIRKVYTHKHRQMSNKGTLHQQYIFGNQPFLAASVDKS